MENGEDGSITARLPDDTLLHVLARFPVRELLSVLCFVCRRWNRLCHSLVVELVPPPIQLTPNGKPWGKKLFVDIRRIAQTHSLTLHTLELNSFPCATTGEVISLIQSLRRLTNLSIISCEKLEKGQIVHYLPRRLRRLDLHSKPTFPTLEQYKLPCADYFLLALQRSCPELTALNLDCSMLVTKSVTINFNFLSSLDFWSLKISWSDVYCILDKCTDLRHLSVVSPLLADKPPPEERALLTRLRNRRIKFLSLRLYTDVYVTASLKKVLYHPHLQCLYAQGSVSASDWRAIFYCPQLEVLDLSKQNGQSLNITEAQEKALCGLCEMLRKLQRLALPAGTGKILTALGRHCPQLKELRFRVFPGAPYRVSDVSIKALAEGCSKLQVLDIEGGNITVSGIRHIAFHCKDMRVLHLNKCLRITDEAITELFPSLAASLRYLDLSGCSITKSALEHIKDHGGSVLRMVRISEPLITSCPELVEELQERGTTLGAWRGYNWDGFYQAAAVWDS